MQIPQDGVIIQKTPAGDWDLTIDWGCPSRNLGEDTIESSAWVVEGPDESLELDDESISEDGKETTVWISGGTVGNFYSITNTITTEDGRILTGTFIVQVVEYVFFQRPETV